MLGRPRTLVVRFARGVRELPGLDAVHYRLDDLTEPRREAVDQEKDENKTHRIRS